MMCRGIDDLLRSSWAFARHQLREPVLVASVLDSAVGLSATGPIQRCARGSFR